MKAYLYGFAAFVVIALVLMTGHFKRVADQEHQNALLASEANDTLATANATLNARNNTLVESLNARSNELEAAQRRADANRTAYQQALNANRDWATGRVPDSVAASLRRATGGEDSTSSEVSNSE